MWPVSVSPCELITLSMINPKGTSGISWLKKPEDRRRGSSRALGTSFVGTDPLEWVSSLIEQMLAPCVRRPY